MLVSRELRAPQCKSHWIFQWGRCHPSKESQTLQERASDEQSEIRMCPWKVGDRGSLEGQWNACYPTPLGQLGTFALFPDQHWSPRRKNHVLFISVGLPSHEHSQIHTINIPCMKEWINVLLNEGFVCPVRKSPQWLYGLPPSADPCPWPKLLHTALSPLTHPLAAPRGQAGEPRDCVSDQASFCFHSSISFSLIWVLGTRNIHLFPGCVVVLDELVPTYLIGRITTERMCFELRQL